MTISFADRASMLRASIAENKKRRNVDLLRHKRRVVEDAIADIKITAREPWVDWVAMHEERMQLETVLSQLRDMEPDDLDDFDPTIPVRHILYGEEKKE